MLPLQPLKCVCGPDNNEEDQDGNEVEQAQAPPTRSKHIRRDSVSQPDTDAGTAGLPTKSSMAAAVGHEESGLLNFQMGTTEGDSTSNCVDD